MPDALVVDDHRASATALAAIVRREGYQVATSAALEEARTHLARHPVDLILLDLHLPDGDGLRLIDAIGDASTTAVVLITAEATFESAISALRCGVTDYLTKPVDIARLRTILRQVAQTSGLAGELARLQASAAESGRFGHIVGRSDASRALFATLGRVAPTSAPILITGESGTGKEVVARTLHDCSRRRYGSFVAINCGAITPTLMESELFGHERGAFTGANQRHRGVFECAHEGTLLLDEVTEMPLDLQVKLLRVLEDGTVTRVGGEQPMRADVRIVAASNRDPVDAIAQGRLRRDLYYRLRGFEIHLPPLRDRPQDIGPLVEHFLARLADTEGATKPLSDDVLPILERYAWPGNVRELKNILHSAWVLADRNITPADLPPSLTAAPPARVVGSAVTIRVGTPLDEAERILVLATLDQHHGNKTRTAATLGISLKTLYARLADYAADAPQARVAAD